MFFQAEDGRRDLVRSRGLGDVYKRRCLDRTSFNGAFSGCVRAGRGHLRGDERFPHASLP